MSCHTPIVTITSTNGFGDHPFRLSEQKFDSGGIISVLPLYAGKIVEVEAKDRLKVIGLGHNAEGRIKQPTKDDRSNQNASRNICNSAQALKNIAHAKGCNQAPENPRLVVELEDGIDAIPKLVTKINELGGKNEQSTKSEQ